MKAFISAIAILTIIGIFIAVHCVLMIDLAKDISQNCTIAEKYANAESWNKVTEQLDKIKKIWDTRRTWVALTISTEEIEEIEISLSQSKVFAELHQKNDFMGEFKMFTMLIAHIPHQEGFHIAEIL